MARQHQADIGGRNRRRNKPSARAARKYPGRAENRQCPQPKAPGQFAQTVTQPVNVAGAEDNEGGAQYPQKDGLNSAGGFPKIAYLWGNVALTSLKSSLPA